VFQTIRQAIGPPSAKNTTLNEGLGRRLNAPASGAFWSFRGLRPTSYPAPRSCSLVVFKSGSVLQVILGFIERELKARGAGTPREAKPLLGVVMVSSLDPLLEL
jgi:hypothetical protein